MQQDLWKQRQELQARLIGKAWADPAFKAVLLQNPDQTIRQFMEDEGIPLPPNADQYKIRVMEETPTDLIFVLPAMPEGLQLSDEQLDAMAGRGNACTSGGSCGTCVYDACNSF